MDDLFVTTGTALIEILKNNGFSRDEIKELISGDPEKLKFYLAGTRLEILGDISRYDSKFLESVLFTTNQILNEKEG